MSWAGDYLKVRGRSFIKHNHTLLGVNFFFVPGSWKGYLFVGEGIMHQSVAMRPPCVNGEGVVEGLAD